MATLKNTRINGTNYLRLPKGSGGQRPGNNPGRIRYNTDDDTVEYYSGGNQQTSQGWAKLTIPFKTRQIISNGYMQGGYKSSAAWNNLNRTITATDTTYNLGDGTIEAAFNYQWGACSKDYNYVFGAGGGHAVSSNYTIAFNMRTETQATDIDRTLPHSRHNFGGVFQEHLNTWMCGSNNNNLNKYNMTTKTELGNIGQNFTTGSVWGMSHEDYGLFYQNNNNRTFVYATETLSSRGGTTCSNHPQQKSINSKIGIAWAGNEGGYNGGNAMRKTYWSTNTTSGTYAKPHTNCGEENFTMGQDHQYMLGQYNGAQNNLSWRWDYATDGGRTGGSSMEPKGKAGASSGVCGWGD